MMVYNNDKFLKHAIDAVAGWCEGFVVVEGAWSPSAESQRSTDHTLKILDQAKEQTGIEVIYWKQQPIEQYDYRCDIHAEWVKSAIRHPFYDGVALQQQLLARDAGLRRIMSMYPPHEDPGWLWIVDSDEIYQQEAILGLSDWLYATQDDYDFYTINGKNFYFNGKQYHDEWYRRLFRIKSNCFFSDDNSLETPDGPYTRTMNIPPEICEFYHYGYCGEFRVRKKLEMWQQEPVKTWWAKHEKMMRGEEEYDGSPVHLFGSLNPGYANYKLVPFHGDHPAGVNL
jgi:hypothetical protein